MSTQLGIDDELGVAASGDEGEKPDKRKKKESQHMHDVIGRKSEHIVVHLHGMALTHTVTMASASLLSSSTTTKTTTARVRKIGH